MEHESTESMTDSVGFEVNLSAITWTQLERTHLILKDVSNNLTFMC